jgi:hypothetical protein
MVNAQLSQAGSIWRTYPDGRERLASLLEIYATALEELRALGEPKAAMLIASLESLNAAAAREARYWDASAHAARRLG